MTLDMQITSAQGPIDLAILGRMKELSHAESASAAFASFPQAKVRSLACPLLQADNSA
jgi:hypothetical protein